MKIYRVTYTESMDSSHGYSYHGSLAKAEVAAKEFRQNYQDKPDIEVDVEIHRLHIEPTKAGIISALMRYGSHADNG